LKEFKFQPIAIDSIIVDELPKRYMHIYRLVDEILEAGSISENLLERIVEILRNRWVWDYGFNKMEGKYLGKN
jgi:hypothetical protein